MIICSESGSIVLDGMDTKCSISLEAKLNMVSMSKDLHAIVKNTHYCYSKPITKTSLVEPMTCIASDKVVAFGSVSGKVYLYCSETGVFVVSFQPFFEKVNLIATLNHHVACCDASSISVSSFDKILFVVPHSKVQQLHIKFNKLFSCSLDHTIQIHDLDTGIRMTTIVFPEPVYCMLPYILTGPSNSLFAGTNKGIYRSQKEITLFAKSKVTFLSNTDEFLVAGTDSGSVLCYDVCSLVLIKSLSLFNTQIVYISPLIQKQKFKKLKTPQRKKYNPEFQKKLIFLETKQKETKKIETNDALIKINNQMWNYINKV